MLWRGHFTLKSAQGDHEGACIKKYTIVRLQNSKEAIPDDLLSSQVASVFDWNGSKEGWYTIKGQFPFAGNGAIALEMITFVKTILMKVLANCSGAYGWPEVPNLSMVIRLMQPRSH